MRNFKFFTLLFIDFENRYLSKNGISGGFDEQIQIFINCCENLGKSLIYFANIELTVLTNNKKYIEKLSPKLNCIEIEFDFKVPKDIDYFSAHHKIDVFRYFSSLNDDDYFFLIDCDMLSINKMPLNLINCINNNLPVYFDVTEQEYPAFSREIIIKDKEILMTNEKSTGLWAGGEFIGGGAHFFKLLSDEIMIVQEKYFNSYKQLHHRSDETLTSVAIEKIMRTTCVVNAGNFGGVGRYHSNKTLHVQKLWGSHEDNFLLHLPSDKTYIASLDFIDDRIINKYKYYLNINVRLNSIKKMIKNLIKNIVAAFYCNS